MLLIVWEYIFFAKLREKRWPRAWSSAIAATARNGQKTGYFLDQKFNHVAAGAFCKGKKVLDTFTHTGAFGLNAVKAGATDVTSVDISPEAVEMVKHNIKINHADKQMEEPEG